MNWFEKIKAKTNKSDDSLELKSGQIKNIINDEIQKELNQFSFKKYQNGFYYYQSVTEYEGHEIRNTLHIGFSLKERNFQCSISSCFNRTYDFEHQYNTGPLNPHIDLIALVKKTGIIKIEESAYFHNGKLNTTTQIVRNIVEDYKKEGINFLNRRMSALKNDQFMRIGLNFIDNLNVDPTDLKRDLCERSKEVKYRVSRVNNPLFEELKLIFIKTEGGEKEYRQRLPKLAYELLEYYCDKRIAKRECK
jgi:hypothetical protein